MNNQYPRLDPNGVYHNPTPAPLQPLAFDPNTGWSGSPNYSAHNTGVAQPTNPMTVGQARVLDGMGQTNAPTMQTYGLNAPSLSSAFQSPVGGYTPNVVPTPSYTPDMAKVAPSLGASFKSMIGLGGDEFSQMRDGVRSAVNTAGANASTAWGKMNYGEKGTAMLGAATGLYGAYNAHKTNKLANKQFNFTKDAFNRNFEATAKTTNAALADRQNARHLRDPKAHASVSDYMKKYGV